MLNSGSAIVILRLIRREPVSFDHVFGKDFPKDERATGRLLTAKVRV
jgi:hypothetical protein